jgi:hypothetical protein
MIWFIMLGYVYSLFVNYPIIQSNYRVFSIAGTKNYEWLGLKIIALIGKYLVRNSPVRLFILYRIYVTR